jgi:predicted CXXCH cytochrome family protein
MLVLLFVLALSGGYAYGQFTGDGSKATVVGSDHDLSNDFSGATAVCEFCHVPHKFNALSTQPPLLWNVTVRSGPYATYSSSGSSTFNATDIRDPSTASGTNGAAYMSLLCLSCHDGSVNQTVFYQTTSGMGGSGSISPPNIGGNGGAGGGLSNDHPVDFTYSATLSTQDGGLRTPTEGAGVRIPYVGTGNLPLFKDQSTDTSGRVECASCHNPHNNTNQNFLRMANSASALCLNCHST